MPAPAVVAFPGPPIPQKGWFDTIDGMRWINQLWQASRGGGGGGSAPGGTFNNASFTGTSLFSNGNIQNGQILLATGGYFTLIDVQEIIHNADNNSHLGGTAGEYVQVLVDSSLSTVATLHSGIRVQIESYQTCTTTPNDVVGGYFGMYNGGVNSGGFGYHTDTVHAATGANCSSYGGNAELFRTSAAGFTVGFHTRSIGGAGKLNNDYGFLVSPGGTGTFTSCFAAGSSFTSSINCQFGVDLRQCFASQAQIFIYAGVGAHTPWIQWGQQNGAVQWQMGYNNANGLFEMYYGANPVFSIIPTTGAVSTSAAIVSSTSGGANGKFMDVYPGGIHMKLQLFNP